jgi:glycosyltransferase involved in cell wall biosynthesis
MTEKIPEAQNKNIVVEGICIEKPLNIEPKGNIKTILYAGTLDKFSCVEDLVNAFLKIKNKNCKLIICGKGYLTPMIVDAAQKDNRIIYKGLVSRDEVLKLQQSATFVINPRKPDNSITRFSFPSKTMEYLSSGTPMIGYKLDGIPSEYYEHYYTINDLSEKTLIETLEYLMSLPQEELNEKARIAHQFVMENKTTQKQVKRIIDFIS